MGMKLWWTIGTVVLVLLAVGMVAAAPGGVFADSCYSVSSIDNGELTNSLTITNTCVENDSIAWVGDVNLTVLGDVVDGELEIAADWMAVESGLRPDLDAPAVLTFNKPKFAISPKILRDGIECTSCNSTYADGVLQVVVPGFSNYSLTYQQDFTVYSDAAPELKQKVYQTVDLGDARRGTEYTCIVQVFGRNPQDEWVLVQTNPQREVQGKLLGNPDANQPESLGYFPTVNGIANTYFRNDNLYGYMNFELVIQCTSNSTAKLVYEEPIMTEYSPAGRPLVSRGVWISQGDNAFYLSVYVVLAFLVLWIGGSVWRSLRR